MMPVQSVLLVRVRWGVRPLHDASAECSVGKGEVLRVRPLHDAMQGVLLVRVWGVRTLHDAMQGVLLVRVLGRGEAST